MIFLAMCQSEKIQVMKQILLILAGSLIGLGANAQVVSLNQLVGYTFDTDVQTPASVDPLVSASDFNLSSGTVSFVQGNPTSGSAVSGINWNVADGAKWWEFTLTPNAGYELNLSVLQFDDRASPTGPTNWSVSVNGNVVISEQTSHLNFTSSPMNTVDLTDPMFQGLSSAYVQIFGYDASGPVGTWRLDNVTLGGSVIAVPEPHVSAVAAVACLFVLVGRTARFRRPLQGKT
jgi:hypothetical protein